MKNNSFNEIPLEFYDNLPEEIKNACDLFLGPRKDIFLLSLLVSYGATFSNVYTHYRGDRLYPNLYLVVYSRAGSGKNSMKWIRIIFDDINEQEIEDSRNEKTDEKTYRTLFIAPNITSARWALQLANNYNNQGLIFSTEAETLTKSSSARDMGGFTDGLRICSEGEPYEVMRKTANEHLIIKEPKLALIISGTPNQILSFIPSAEDGLASRVLYYSFEGVTKWDNVILNNDLDITYELNPVKDHAYNLYVYLKKQGEIKVVFSDKQIEQLNSIFEKWTIEGQNEYGTESIPFIFRLAPRILKFGMILTIIKISSLSGFKLKSIKCSDADFRQSLVLGQVLIKKAMLYLDLLKNHKIHSKYYGQKFDLLMQLPETFLTREFIEIAIQLNIRRRTAEALLAKFTEESLVHKIKKGHYKNLFNNIKIEQNEKSS